MPTYVHANISKKKKISIQTNAEIKHTNQTAEMNVYVKMFVYFIYMLVRICTYVSMYVLIYLKH